MKSLKINADWYWIIFRIIMGSVLLWSFFDKVFGLGYSTPSNASWLNGGSPTAGFLKSLNGPFHNIFNSMSGMTAIDWLFMAGLLCIGLGLVLGLFTRITCYAGILFFFMLWLAVFPSKTNPVIDQHSVYILVLIGFLIYNPAKRFSIDNLINIFRRHPERSEGSRR